MADVLLKVLGINPMTVAGMRVSDASINIGDTKPALSISGKGVFKDADSDQIVRAAFFDDQALQMEVNVPDVVTISAALYVHFLEYYSSQNDGLAFTISLSTEPT